MRSLLFVPVLSLLVHAQQCYSPDGKVLPQDGAFFSGFQACSSGGPSTICCATNRTNPAGGDAAKGDTKDECLPNGLCQNRVTKSGVESTLFFANFCTDSNFTSGNCLNICEQTRGTSGNTEMTSCTGRADSDRWCCGGNNKACCGSGIGLVTLPQKFGGAIIVASSSIAAPSSLSTRSSSSPASSQTSSASSSSASSSSSPSSTSAPAQSASTTPTPSPKKSGLSGGAIAGIVIGALAGVALLGAAIFFAMRANKYKKASRPQPAEVHANSAIPPQYDGYANESGGSEKYARQQMGGPYSARSDVPLVELQQPPSELPGSESGMKYAR